MQVADKMKPGVWIVKDNWVQKHGLAAELPQGLQMSAGGAPTGRDMQQ